MNMIVKEARDSDISVLGVELLVEILCRLGSAKYATQCTSVCKLWYILINTRSDCSRRWDQINSKTESLTLITRGLIEHDSCKETPASRASLDFLPCFNGREQVYVEHDSCKETPASRASLDFLPCFNGREQVYVVGSHKDLLLCCPNYHDRSCYYICNPLTKQWTALPPPPPLGRRHPTEDESRSINFHTQVEFIVDERVDGGVKFTVVRVNPYHVQPLWGGLDDEKVQVSVFTSDGGWREMEDGGAWREMFQSRRSCKKIVSYKGSLVWLMRKEFSVSDVWRQEFSEEVRLYKWDLDSNYTRLPLIPPDVNLYRTFSGTSTIGVFEGRLRMAHLVDDHRKLFVWQFDDCQTQQEFELDFGRLVMKNSQPVRVITRAMAFHPHDGDILYMLVDTTPTLCGGDRGTGWSSHIFMYNLKRRRLELMRNLPEHSVENQLFPLVMNCWPTSVPRLQS